MESNAGNMHSMITFDQAGHRFTYRVCAIIVGGDFVLLTSAPHLDFWYTPGGRVEFGETSEAALRRELREELAVEAEVSRLLWVVENLYQSKGVQQHELGFYYKVQLPAHSPYANTNERYTRNVDGEELIFRWFRRYDLRNEPVQPAFLREALGTTPAHTALIVNRG